MIKDGETQANLAARGQENVAPVRTCTRHPASNTLTPLQNRRPGKFEYFPVNVPGAVGIGRAPDADANALVYGFGLLKLQQTPFNNIAGIYVHDINIVNGVFSPEEGISRSFVVTGVPLELRSQAISRHFPVSPANLFSSATSY